MALLRILAGEHSGRTVDLRDDTIVIGRHPGCDIRVPDETVSRRHARIIVAEGGYFIEDLGSRNGTYVNGQRVTSPLRLCDLDTISIFNTAVEFREEAVGRAVDGTVDQTIVLNGHVRTGSKPAATKPAGKKAIGPKAIEVASTGRGKRQVPNRRVCSRRLPRST